MSDEKTGTVTTKVPARLDRLPWSRWHWVVVIGLVTVWILDGLEVTVVGNISGQISKSGSGIAITQSQVSGLGAAMYVLGAPAGRPLAVTHSADEERMIAESALRDAVTDALGDQAEPVAVQAVPGLGGRVLVEAARKYSAELIVLAGRDGGGHRRREPVTDRAGRIRGWAVRLRRSRRGVKARRPGRGACPAAG